MYILFVYHWVLHKYNMCEVQVQYTGPKSAGLD